jgi:diguanylate cyclase (GGDEF)-like protein
MSYAFVALVKEQSDWDLWQASRQDALTGLGNRRDLDDTLDKAVRTSRRTGAPLALIMIDVDQFKTFNDHYGHPAGDACLRAIAGALRDGLVRREDRVSRYGGEEFTVILADTREAEAVAIAERLRLAVRAMNLPHAGRPEGIVTISLGVAVMTGEASAAIADAAALIDAADHALYRAKEAGRDRVESVSGPVAAPPPAMAPAPSLRLDTA